jgi:hypothetical protein
VEDNVNTHEGESAASIEKRRIDIVGTKINITQHQDSNGEKKWVSVSNSANGTGDDVVKVTINGEEVYPSTSPPR